MPRPIWRGTITFGLIGIPVKLYVATESKDVSFNQLHTECNSRIQMKRWCPVCEKEVPREEIERGYQYAKDQYVLVSDEELENVPVASTRTISLSAFVDSEQLDPMMHERSYWLEPDEGGTKAYGLLLRALEKRKLVGVAAIALRAREHLCALRPSDGALVLDTLHYADEIRMASKPDVPDVKVTEKELTMAEGLIDMLVEKFDHEKYGDQYREALLEMIERKVGGKEAVEAPPQATPTPVTDLMEALRASLAAAKKPKAAAPSKAKPAKRPARAQPKKKAA